MYQKNLPFVINFINLQQTPFFSFNVESTKLFLQVRRVSMSGVARKFFRGGGSKHSMGGAEISKSMILYRKKKAFHIEHHSIKCTFFQCQDGARGADLPPVPPEATSLVSILVQKRFLKKACKLTYSLISIYYNLSL